MVVRSNTSYILGFGILLAMCFQNALPIEVSRCSGVAQNLDHICQFHGGLKNTPVNIRREVGVRGLIYAGKSDTHSRVAKVGQNLRPVKRPKPFTNKPALTASTTAPVSSIVDDPRFEGIIKHCCRQLCREETYLFFCNDPITDGRVHWEIAYPSEEGHTYPEPIVDDDYNRDDGVVGACEINSSLPDADNAVNLPLKQRPKDYITEFSDFDDDDYGTY